MYRYGYAFPGLSRLFTNTLTVVSAHDSPAPSGTTTNAYGGLITARADAYETYTDSVRYDNLGWVLSGGQST